MNDLDLQNFGVKLSLQEVQDILRRCAVTPKRKGKSCFAVAFGMQDAHRVAQLQMAAKEFAPSHYSVSPTMAKERLCALRAWMQEHKI
ncbi:MAG: hypothetical protein AAF352_01590, partial [Pseudomonadota bacterium]